MLLAHKEVARLLVGGKIQIPKRLTPPLSMKTNLEKKKKKKVGRDRWATMLKNH